MIFSKTTLMQVRRVLGGKNSDIKLDAMPGVCEIFLQVT